MKKWMFLLVGLVCLVGAQPAKAQVRFGPQVAWSDEFDLGLGGRAEFGLANALGIDDGPFANLYGTAAATYFFTDCPDISCSMVELNPNAAVPFEIEGASVTPFAGAGLHLARVRASGDVPGVGTQSRSDTEVGLNILGGIKFPVGDFGGFAEGKFGFAGVDHFTLSAGVLFGGR